MGRVDGALIARAAAHARWANTPDRAAATAPARQAADDRFELKAREMHPDATDEQIHQVAESLRKAHFAKMALRSAQARRGKKVARLRELADKIEATLPQAGG